MMSGTSDARRKMRGEAYRHWLEFWGPPRYGDLGIFPRKPILLRR